MDSHVGEPKSSSYVLKDEAGRQYVVTDDSNGDVYHSGDEPYPEMTKEHLLRHSGKPLWRRLRALSVIIIVLGWLALIAATIAIIVIHPRCKQTPSISWWQKSVVYRIYVRSFQDSDGDGIGDLKGVFSRLEYLKGLGVSTISLSPFYHHVQAENEFSVLNHTEVDSHYGTMEDFQELVKGVHDNGMKLVVDFIPGTTSNENMWFKESQRGEDKSNDYRNYYHWVPGPTEPTNWLTVYSGKAGNAKMPAWTLDNIRNSTYLHQFLSSQPSLNLRNDRVQLELENILRFWIETGVDGFYVRNSAYLLVDYDLRDESPKDNSGINDANNYDFYNHDRTFGLPEINDMFARWRHLVNSDDNSDEADRFIMADIHGSIEQTMAYYGRYGRDGVDISLNYDLLPVDKDCNGTCVKNQLDTWFNNIPADSWLNWMVGIEDTKRVSTRLQENSSLSRCLTMLTMTLPGTPIAYYGEEIGMLDVSDTPAELWSMDQQMRSPMQWNNDTEGGFMTNCTDASCTAWMSPGDFWKNNVALQEEDENSYLALFKILTGLRANPTMQYGLFQYDTTNENIVSFRREFDGLSTYLVVINFGKVKATHNFSPSDDVPEGVVEAATHPDGSFKQGATIALNGLTLNPWEGVVLSWDYQIKQY